MKWTLPGLATAFCLGIIIANYTTIPFFFFYGFACLFLISAFVLFKKDLAFCVVLLCIFFSIGAILLKSLLLKEQILLYLLLVLVYNLELYKNPAFNKVVIKDKNSDKNDKK